MTTRSHVVRLEAEVSKYTSGMAKAEKSTEQVRKAAEAMGKAVDEATKKANGDRQAKDLAALAAAHQKAAKAADMSYDAQGNLVDQNGRLVSSNRAAVHGLDAFSQAVYKTGYEAEQAAEKQRRAAAAAEELAAKQRAASTEIGTGLLAFGTASVAALGASTKAAMDWESAWAGVTKTVDGSPEQMADLEQQLRNLAKTLPATHEEIAGVAEAAGQLGVKRKDIVAFTKTMIDLQETTNLTADEAATSIAQLLNVMGDAGGEVDNLGATLVALGNDGASTEKDILSMAQRISGAGKLVGASKDEVLALASTLSSLGIEAELGGGVTSRVLQRMYADVMEGGKGLQALAKVAGTTGPEFAKAWQESPVKALDMVAQGLNTVKANGGNVVAVMDELGIKGTEETGVMLRLAGAGDLLNHSLDVGAKAWKENSALTEEASKRYETTESKVKVAWNNIKDAAIDAGAVVLPIVQHLAEGAAGVAQGFGALPQPVQAGITVLSGVAGVAALGAGAFLTFVPRIAETRAALKDLAPAGSKANAVLSRTGSIAKGAAVGVAALGASTMALQPMLDGLYKPTGATADALKVFSGQAAQGSVSAKTLNDSFSDLVEQTDGVSSFQQAINGIADPGIWGNIDNVAVTGINVLSLGMAKAESTSERARSRFKAMGIELASLDPSKAAQSFQTMAAQTDGSETSLKRLLEYMPDYRRSLEEQAKASGKATDDQSLLNIAMEGANPAAAKAAAANDILQTALEETGVGLDGVVEDMEKFLDLLFRSGQITMDSREANAQYNEALRNIPATMDEIAKSGGKMGATLLENKTDFDLSTEAGAKANGAFQALAQKGMAEVKAKADEGVGQAGLQEKLQKTYDDLLLSAKGMGISEGAAETLTRKVLGVPDGVSIESWMNDAAKRTAEQTKGAIDAIPTQKNVQITTTLTEIKRFIQEGSPATADGSYGQGLGVLAKKAKGGHLADVPGLAGGGRVPGRKPASWSDDNMLGLTPEGYVGLQGDEWVVNGQSSNKYDAELTAINNGTFPKYYEQGNYAAASTLVPMQAAAPPQVTVAPPMVKVLVGNQELDARIEVIAGQVVYNADSASQFNRRGR